MRPRRYGRPVQPPGGWPESWLEEDRGEWFRRALAGQEPYEVLGARTGRPDPRTWHGKLIAARVRVVCSNCGSRPVATLEEYEGGLLWHQNRERRAGARLACPRHGALHVERDRFQDVLELARQDGAMTTLRARPRESC